MKKQRRISRKLGAIATALLWTTPSLLWAFMRPASAQTAAGTIIENTATGSFLDTSDNLTKEIFSNKVTVQVVEVAGISVTNTAIIEAPINVTNAGTYQGIAGINTGDVVYFDFTVTNLGNDPTAFFIPNNAQITGGTLAGNIQIIAVDPDGSGATMAKVLTTPVDVTTGNSTIALLGTTDGYIPPTGTVKVRVPVKVIQTTVGSNISVMLGNTTPANSQNVDYVNSGNDIYTVDLANDTVVPSETGYTGTIAEATGVPANGVREASNTQFIPLVETPVVQGFKSVKLTDDPDENGVSATDEITWTITYKNTSGVPISNFQISDVLDPNTTRIDAGAITVSLKDLGGISITPPNLNSSYTGAEPNSNLLASGYTLPANATITINVPVRIPNGTANNTLISNQPKATGDNLPAAGFLTDNIDNTTTGLPQYVSVPPESITQNQLPSIDPTVVVTGEASLQGYKSVKLTIDNGTTGLNPGDIVTWTVIYKNTGTVDIPNFQITDALPSGVQRNATPITISATGSGQTTPTVNPSYNGTGTNTLFQNPVTLKTGSVIIVNIPVEVKTGTESTTQNNQATATGNNLNNPVNTDNVDSDTGITEVPVGSIKQTQASTIDPTVITIPPAPTPIISGYKSVKLTDDLDNSSTITPDDTLTWTITYVNTGTVDATGFQINDTLPSGLTIAGTPSITTNTTQGTAPTANASYTGTSSNTALLQNATTLKAGGIITVNIPVTIDTGVTGDKLNQAIASGTNISNTNTDNIDSNTTGLPTGVIVPATSVNQVQTPAIEETKVTIVAPPSPDIFGYKSVKLTTDADTSNSVTPGDTVTWTIIYKNAGTVATTDFQITDSLPSGVTKSGTPTVTVSGATQTTPTIDTTYNGTTNTNLFSTPVPLEPDSLIVVKIPVTIDANQVGNKTNQALGNGTLSDNVDKSTSGLDVDVLEEIEDGSIDQNEQSSLDPTVITIPEVKGFKSVKLTGDTDNNNTVTAGDVITWRITYVNTGTTDITNFQITDNILDQPSGSNLTLGTPLIDTDAAHTKVTTSTPTINPSYTGTGTGSNINLLQSPITLKAGEYITINFPVTIKATTPADTTLQNQSTAIASNLPVAGIKSDNIDDHTTGLPVGATVTAGSIDQTQTPAIEPTIVKSSIQANPNLLLVKRITAVNGNSTGFDTFKDDTNTGDDNDPNWPNNFLKGELTTTASPGDVVDYTIYFLNTGNGAASNVEICDLLSQYLTYIPNTYDGGTPTDGGLSNGLGIALNFAGATVYMTGVAGDGTDRGQFIRANILPAGCVVQDSVTNTFRSATSVDNQNGTVVVNLSTVAPATGVGTPNNSYGYIRFRATVK